MTSTTNSVTYGSEVTLHFSLSLENGDLIDSNFNTKAPTFTLGDGNLLPGFEQHLVGMRVGERKVFRISPNEGFGEVNSQNILEVSKDEFSKEYKLEEGLVLSFRHPSGGELPGVVRSIDESVVVIDFNHPLAGQTILFEAEVIKIHCN